MSETVKARLRAHPCWALLILYLGFTAISLFALGIFYPPGPFGSLPYGPVSLSVAFPIKPIAGREPIVSGGVKGATYSLSVESVGAGQVRFVYEAWGSPEQVSPAVAIAPAVWYPLLIDLPQLHPPTAEAGVPLTLVFNGNQILRQQVPYAQLAVKSLWIGTNPLNGPYLGRDIFPGPPKPYAFSGQIRGVQRVATSPDPHFSLTEFLANRLFPNLRYEVEISPHIFYWSVLIGALAALATVFPQLPSGAPRHVFLSRLRFLLTPVAITAFPILPMLQISRTYRADWLNHGWIMEYYGQFLKAHHWLPHMVNSHQATGMVSPLFYGHLLYSIGGFFSAALGGDIGIRLALFTALLCQTLCVRRTVRGLTGSLAMADTASAVVCWAIYPITNLYGGSIMEFMAVCYFSCCLCLFLDFCRRTEPGIPWLATAEFALCFVLTANHPITGMLGALVLAAMAVTFFVLSASRARVVKPLLASAALVLVLLLPWLQIYARYGKQIYIGRETTTTSLEYFEFDTLLARFIPFPYDAKSISIGALSETSYADMQLNLPLLLAGLAGFVFAGRAVAKNKSSRDELPAKGLICVGWCVLAWALAASLSPWFAALTSSFTNRLRYAFRLVNVQNWGLLLVVLAWCWLYSLRGRPRRGMRFRVWLPSFCAALLTLCSVSMLQKWAHGSAATRQSAIGHSQQRALSLPYTFYWLMDYVGNAPEIAPPANLKQAVNFPVLEGARFAEVQPIDVDLAEKKWLVFNTVATPVNQIYIDGSQVPEKDIYREWVRAVVQVDSGKHRIEYRFSPGITWTILRTATESLFLGLAIACFYVEIRKIAPLTANR